MKKGINQWVFPATLPLREVFRITRKYGFQGIELCPDEEGELSIHLPVSKRLLPWPMKLMWR